MKDAKNLWCYFVPKRERKRIKGREGEREAERHIEMITLCHEGPKLFPVQCGLEENKSSQLVLFISSLIISVFQCAIIIVLLETRDFLSNTVKKMLRRDKNSEILHFFRAPTVLKQTK